jgi:hypothetical protein
MKLIQSTLIVLMLLTITACSSIPQVLNVDAKPVERTPIVLPDVDKFVSRDVEWIIITPENVDEVFAQLRDNDTRVVVFAIDENGWTNLSLNMADLLKLVQQQKSIIAAYEQYYVEK